MISIIAPEPWVIGHVNWEVWTDTEVSVRDGRCIGVGKTREEAIENAKKELQEDLDQLEAARWGVAADTE